MMNPTNLICTIFVIHTPEIGNRELPDGAYEFFVKPERGDLLEFNGSYWKVVDIAIRPQSVRLNIWVEAK